MNVPAFISVIIPAYNEEKELPECLDAIFNQTLPKDQYEVLVIDNNSTDKTAKIAKEKGARVIPYTKKQGITVTKQFGTKNAKGDILAFLDADSSPSPDWLEKGVLVFKDKKRLIIGGIVLPKSGTAFTKALFYIYDGISRLNQLLGISLLWGGNLIVRKSSFDEIDGFNTHLKKGEDWDLSMRIRRKFGRGSTLYTNKLVVYASPRKQENLRVFIPYLYHGIVNYIYLFVLGKSKAIGDPVTVR